MEGLWCDTLGVAAADDDEEGRAFLGVASRGVLGVEGRDTVTTAFANASNVLDTVPVVVSGAARDRIESKGRFLCESEMGNAGGSSFDEESLGVIFLRMMCRSFTVLPWVVERRSGEQAKERGVNVYEMC